jgi:hypothetical protein
MADNSLFGNSDNNSSGSSASHSVPIYIIGGHSTNNINPDIDPDFNVNENFVFIMKAKYGQAMKSSAFDILMENIKLHARNINLPMDEIQDSMLDMIINSHETYAPNYSHPFSQLKSCPNIELCLLFDIASNEYSPISTYHNGIMLLDLLCTRYNPFNMTEPISKLDIERCNDITEIHTLIANAFKYSIYPTTAQILAKIQTYNIPEFPTKLETYNNIIVELMEDPIININLKDIQTNPIFKNGGIFYLLSCRSTRELTPHMIDRMSSNGKYSKEYLSAEKRRNIYRTGTPAEKKGAQTYSEALKARKEKSIFTNSNNNGSSDNEKDRNRNRNRNRNRSRNEKNKKKNKTFEEHLRNRKKGGTRRKQISRNKSHKPRNTRYQNTNYQNTNYQNTSYRKNNEYYGNNEMNV